MKQIAEFIPIILFFIVYQLDGESIAVAGWHYRFDGIFSATAALMIATLLQVAITYAVTRSFEKRLLWLLLAVLIFGGATLVFRNQVRRGATNICRAAKIFGSLRHIFVAPRKICVAPRHVVCRGDKYVSLRDKYLSWRDNICCGATHICCGATLNPALAS